MATRFIDFSGLRPGATAVKNAGAAGVLRYLSPNISATAWKRASKSEVQSYIAVGVDVILNFEWYEGRMLEGAVAGTNDGKTALSAAKALGYPKGATIYFSHDTSARNDNAVRDYLKAAAKAMGGYYEVDIYSGYYVVEKMLSDGVARYGWQTLAWSDGKVGRAHLYQNGKTWFKNGADEDVVLHTPLGSWLETTRVNPPRKPTPTPKPPRKPTPSVVTYHVVRSGESLSLIASTYKTSVAQLVSWNKSRYPGLAHNPNLIYPGWKLQVTGGSAPKPAPPKVTVVYHTVKSGEYLSLIASHYHTSVNQLVAWNKAKYPSLAKNPNIIYPNWRLRVK